MQSTCAQAPVRPQAVIRRMEVVREVNIRRIALHSHLTDGTTSHSTRLPKDGNQVAGYRPSINDDQVIG